MNAAKNILRVGHHSPVEGIAALRGGEDVNEQILVAGSLDLAAQ